MFIFSHEPVYCESEALFLYKDSLFIFYHFQPIIFFIKLCGEVSNSYEQKKCFKPNFNINHLHLWSKCTLITIPLILRNEIFHSHQLTKNTNQIPLWRRPDGGKAFFQDREKNNYTNPYPFLKNIIKKLVWHSCLIFICRCHPLSIAMSSTQLRCQRGFLNINLFAASLFEVLLKVIVLSRHLLIAKQASAMTRLLSCFLTLKAILSVITGTHSVMLITMTDGMASHSCPADKQQDWSIIAHESGGVHPLRQG